MLISISMVLSRQCHAVGLHLALWTVDHTSSTTCRYLPAFYTGSKLYCLVTGNIILIIILVLLLVVRTCRCVGVKASYAVCVTVVRCCFRSTTLHSSVLSARPSYTGLTHAHTHARTHTHTRMHTHQSEYSTLLLAPRHKTHTRTILSTVHC